MDFSLSKINNIYYIQIGQHNISVTAFITVLVGSLLAFIVAFFTQNSIYTALSILAASMIMAYEINCYEVGQCTSLAWITSITYSLFCVTLIYMIYQHKPTSLLGEINKLQDLLVSRIRS